MPIRRHRFQSWGWDKDGKLSHANGVARGREKIMFLRACYSRRLDRDVSVAHLVAELC
jgi:hypothetical protein